MSDTYEGALDKQETAMDTSNIPDSDATNYSGYRKVSKERRRINTRHHVSSEEEDIEAEGPLEKRKKENMYPKAPSEMSEVHVQEGIFILFNHYSL